MSGGVSAPDAFVTGPAFRYDRMAAAGVHPMPREDERGSMLAVDHDSCEVSNVVTFDVHDAE